MSTQVSLRGQKILITGLTGQVGQPLAEGLARDNEVWGVARFSDARKKLELERLGIKCMTADITTGDFSALPSDFDYVLNFAVARGNVSFDADIRDGAEAVGLLMGHTRKAKAFFHCSTTGVYQHAGHKELKETDDLGDNHRGMAKTYSISKLAAEAVVRYAARQFNLPTVICRLNVPYGNNGGWPYYNLLDIKAGRTIEVHPEKPALFRLIHEDDIVASVPALLGAAAVPARILNWGGDAVVAQEEWCKYIGELVGMEPKFANADHAVATVLPDIKEMSKLTGPLKTDWKEGIRRMIAARHPEWLNNRA